MSYTRDRAFVQQFSDNLIMLSQQKGSRLLPHVTIQKVTGKYAHFDRLDQVEAVEKTSVHTATPLIDAPHSRRRVSMKDFHAAIAMDNEEQIRMLIDPKSAYARALANALGRKQDDIILEALVGNAVSVDGDDAGANVALPAGQIIDEDFGAANSNLTIAKLIEARRILAKNEVEDEELCLVLNASALASLLGTTQVTSSDYNSVKALVSGDINTFMGFKFVRSERVPGALSSEADPKVAIAFPKSAVGFAMGADIMLKMDELPEKSYATQVYARTTGGAVRIEDEKVVSIQCYQTS